MLVYAQLSKVCHDEELNCKSYKERKGICKEQNCAPSLYKISVGQKCNLHPAVEQECIWQESENSPSISYSQEKKLISNKIKRKLSMGHIKKIHVYTAAKQYIRTWMSCVAHKSLQNLFVSHYSVNGANTTTTSTPAVTITMSYRQGYYTISYGEDIFFRRSYDEAWWLIR